MRFSLTRRAEYGMRILVHLTTIEPGVRVTTSDLAQECEVSPGNVPTIVNVLSRAGLLDCSPGRNGGCMLARDPKQVSVLEAIEVLEGPVDVDFCLLDSRRCHQQDPHCTLHESWAASKAAAFEALRNVTLYDAASPAEASSVPTGGKPKAASRRGK